MNERIKKLTEKTVAGEMWVAPVETEYDRTDLFLSPVKMSAKRVCEYIMNQEPMVLEETCFTGLLRFDDSVEGDIFNRSGHKNFRQTANAFYNKPLENLITFEWQHSAGDFSKVIKNGLCGIKESIKKSELAHEDDFEALEFLETQMTFCDTVIAWAHKCSERAWAMSEKTKNPEYKNNLTRLAESLKKVPENPAESFYEAVLSLYVCYPFVPDSIGLIDRYLYPYFKNDIEKGILSEEEAKSFLQELFLMLQARVHKESDRFYRGGESHFCVGGYLPNGEDGFNEFSKLIVDSLMELPTWIPQISLRWTRKTPAETFRYMMECERRDPNGRIAFVNDEPRIKGLMERSELSYEEAVSYCMVGCNEPALPGGQIQGPDTANIALSIENTLYRRTADVIKAESFEAFYQIFEEELFAVTQRIIELGTEFQKRRALDTNIVSNIFFDGSIENAKSITKRGALDKISATMGLIGITTVIDSLSITKQFVYDEKIVTMEAFVKALQNNWETYEDLHTLIMKKGAFFGNDDNCSNQIAVKFAASLYKFLNRKDNYWNKKFLVGDLIGYNQHNTWFGQGMKATPDGRYAGEPIQFGRQQTNGRDMKGLTALLNSIAKSDPYALFTGPTVTNVMIDEKLINDDAHFEKTVLLFETYLRNGGVHFQLNYVSAEDLKKAKINPDQYKNLRVRVSGFSDYFVNLNEDLQDDVMARTAHAK